MKRIFTFLESTKTVLFLAIIFLLTACQQEFKYELIKLKNPTENLADYDLAAFPTNLVTDEKNIIELQNSIAINKSIRENFYKTVRDVANAGLKLKPEPLADVTLNETQVGGEAIHLRTLAYYWLYLKFTGANPSEYLPYIEKARDVLVEWAKSNNTNSKELPQETNYLGFFEAYSIIRNHISPDDQLFIDSWLIKKGNFYLTFPPRTNNWETIRLLYLYDLGYILSDSKYLNGAESAYQSLLDVNVLEGGKSEDLIKRDAFAYHAYDLLFYGKIFRAKYFYEGKAAMTALINKKSFSNSTVSDMVDYWEPFVKDPAKNPHIEFKNTEYAPDKDRKDYNKPYDPATSIYVMEDLLFAFPHVKTFIQAVNPNNDQSNRKFFGFIYWDFKFD